jgi:hypothetical protein
MLGQGFDARYHNEQRDQSNFRCNFQFQDIAPYFPPVVDCIILLYFR